MPLLKWDNLLETGNELIDNQHRQIFGMLNSLHEAVKAKTDGGLWTACFQDLLGYAGRHFKEEEDFMQRINYPDLKEHKLLHEKLLLDLLDLEQKYRSGEYVLSISLLHFIGEWIQNHIRIEDNKMITWFHNHPPSA